MPPDRWWRVRSPELRGWAALVIPALVAVVTGFTGAIGATRVGWAQSPHVTGVPIEEVQKQIAAAVTAALAPVQADVRVHGHEHLSAGQHAQVREEVRASQRDLSDAIERLTRRIDTLLELRRQGAAAPNSTSPPS